MKTLPAMLGTPALLRELFILNLGLWSSLCQEPAKSNDPTHYSPLLIPWKRTGLTFQNRGEEASCQIQLNVKRNSEYNVSTGDILKIECPVTYCVQRPNVTWCKQQETNCLPLEERPQLHTNWEENDRVSVFVLYFKQINLTDSGLYSCSTNFNSDVVNSHAIAIHVRERAQNYSEDPLTVSGIPDTTNASGPPTREERSGRTWLLYISLPFGALLLLLACFCMVCFLKRLQGKKRSLLT